MKLPLHAAYAAARVAGLLRPRNRRVAPLRAQKTQPGVSVVIPSRNGKDLLAEQLPGIVRELPSAAEIVVVDNGSDDGTAEWLRNSWPQVKQEVSREPLSFARAINRGIGAARYSRICLLNNDMLLDPGFFQALRRAFDEVPRLFCATAQIRFPPGVRREETGKAVLAQKQPEDFPVRCDEPVPGEDLTYVLYGSGGCSLFDAAQLRALGGVDPIYEPAYVEDLDLGYRAWQRGWPSVFVAGAGVEHRHRATTSRYYTPGQLEFILELNYLKFLSRAVSSPQVFRRLWAQALRRLRLQVPQLAAARAVLDQAAAIALAGGPAAAPQLPEDLVLALTNGAVWVFPGRPPSGKPRTLMVSPSPLQLHDRMRRLAADSDVVLVSFTDAAVASEELLEACVEAVLVKRDESQSLRAALQQTVRKWQPSAAELESVQMARYAADCAPARTKLVT